jgi:hypothetical protein
VLAVAASVEAIALGDRWRGLRWPAALAADGAVAVTIALVGRPEGLPESYPPVAWWAAAALSLALPLVYGIALVVSTLRFGRAAGRFDVVQALVAFGLGFGGAIHVLEGHGTSSTVVGLAALALGLASYWVAFTRRPGAPGLWLYANAGGLLIMAGSAVALASARCYVLWCALGLVALGLGRRLDRGHLRYHGALVLGLAALGSGLLRQTTSGLLDGTALAEPPSTIGWIAAAAVMAGALVLAFDRGPTGLARVPHGLAATLAAWTAAGLVAIGVATSAQSWLPTESLAALQASVLAALATLLAAASPRRARPELSVLVTPVLVIAALKLLFGAVPASPPAALFVSLVVYGVALIEVPRLLRREQPH